jgi:hypothetical protein
MIHPLIVEDKTESRQPKVVVWSVETKERIFMGAIAFLISVYRNVYIITEAHVIDARCHSGPGWSKK